MASSSNAESSYDVITEAGAHAGHIPRVLRAAWLQKAYTDA